MPGYRVSFINEIPRNNKLFRCCQRSIVIRSAPDAEQAAEAAKQQFAELEGICDWKIHASQIEIETVEAEPEPRGAAPDVRKARALHKRKVLPKSAHERNDVSGRRPVLQCGGQKA